MEAGATKRKLEKLEDQLKRAIAKGERKRLRPWSRKESCLPSSSAIVTASSSPSRQKVPSITGDAIAAAAEGTPWRDTLPASAAAKGSRSAAKSPPLSLGMKATQSAYGGYQALPRGGNGRASTERQRGGVATL